MELSLLNAKMSVNSTSLTLRTQLFSLFSYLRIVDYEDVELLPPYYMPDIEMTPNRCSTRHGRDRRIRSNNS